MNRGVMTGGTMPRAPNHWGASILPKMSQVLSSICSSFAPEKA